VKQNRNRAGRLNLCPWTCCRQLDRNPQISPASSQNE
jgi:hypothetical protein